MGCSNSILLPKPNSPLEELQLKDTIREQRKRQEAKLQKQITKLQKKHAKKNKKTRKASRTSSIRSSNSRGRSIRQSSGSSVVASGCKDSLEERNRQVESKTEIQLKNNLCTFLMNQISLMIQFYGNFDSEMQTIGEELLTMESEINQQLEEHSIFIANPLDAVVAKWISYKPVHGPDKNHSQPLQSQVLYVIFENVDVARPNDANYDSISPLCKVDLEVDSVKTTPCKEEFTQMLRGTKWKGYVRLKLREDSQMKSKVIAGKNDGVYTDSSSGYSSTSVSSTKPAISNNSGNDSGSEYDYAYITNLNSHHPLSQLKMSSQRERAKLDARVLPDSCVSTLGHFIDANLEDSDMEESDGDDDEDDYSSDDEGSISEHQRDFETLEALRLYKMEIERRKTLLQQRYLNSSEFMRYFGELMRRKLVHQLPVIKSDLEAGTYRGSSIHTSKYEIIPAIHVAHNAQNWPDCAFQFRIRERPVSVNPATGQKMQWPSRAMIKRIENFGFHVIPNGYAPKKSRNPFRELEWRIVFPKAERYLEQHLTQTQVKVFMLAKALVKTFVEPEEKYQTLMFAIDHLRTHLFWECERNFLAWPEEFLGEVLIRFISTFMQRLREKCLRDYFIEERNLFESIPEYSLMTLYSILADIIANPLMHLMVAIKNLDFAENFFPKLNSKKIFQNLCESDMLKLKMLAKNARNLLVCSDLQSEEPRLIMDEGAKGLVGLRQHREKTRGRLRRKTQLLRHTIELKKEEEQQKRASIESINVEFFFSNDDMNESMRHVNQGVENLRRTNLLEIVLDQLVETAEKAVELRAVDQARSCICHAKRLCKIYHNFGCDLGAKDFLTTIHNIEADLMSLHQIGDFTLNPPALPIRTSMEPIQFHRPKEFTARSITHEEVVNSTANEEKKNVNISPLLIIEDNTTPLQNELNDGHSTPKPRKSLRFMEEVVQVQVQVHTDNVNSMEGSQLSKRMSVVRFADVDSIQEINEDEIISKVVPDHNAKEVENTIDDVPETSTVPQTKTLTKSILHKLSPAMDALKNSQIVQSNIVKRMATSTEKVITTISAEENQKKLRHVMRKTSHQIIGAFNMSTDS